jgi:hypothetical protein
VKHRRTQLIGAAIEHFPEVDFHNARAAGELDREIVGNASKRPNSRRDGSGDARTTVD